MGDIRSRIDAVTKIGDYRLKSGGIQPAPKSVKLELTARCNLRCRYCAVRTRKKQPVVDMNYYQMQKITEDIRQSGVEEIGLFYLGESFCNPELLRKAVSWCYHDLQFPYIFLTSNAALANVNTTNDIMENGLDSLKWSVNYNSAKSFQDITGGSVAQFENALANIKSAWELKKQHGYKTTISASSILYSKDYKETIMPFLTEHVLPYVDRHYWLPLYQMSMYAKKVENELGYMPTAGNCGRIDDDTLEPTRPPLPCWCTFTEGHVRVDGGLSACGFGSDDKFDMGMLDGTNFMRQWNSVKFQELRKAQIATLTMGMDALKDTICKVCVVYQEHE